MPDQNFILKSFDEQQNIFISNLTITRNKETKDSIHDLRVAIKKIRSFLRLRQKIIGQEWEGKFVPVKLLFGILGKHRDFEMSLSLLKKYYRQKEPSISSFKKYLKVNLSFSRQLAKAAVNDFNEQELINLVNESKKSLSGFSNEELITKIKNYVEEIARQVTLLANDFEKEAHEIRKLLKDVYYWLRICPYNPVADLIDIKILEQVLDNLGAWQDLFVFRKKLKNFRKEYLLKASRQIEIVRMFEEKIIKDQEEILKQATDDFKNISGSKKATDQSP